MNGGPSFSRPPHGTPRLQTERRRDASRAVPDSRPRECRAWGTIDGLGATLAVGRAFAPFGARTCGRVQVRAWRPAEYSVVISCATVDSGRRVGPWRRRRREGSIPMSGMHGVWWPYCCCWRERARRRRRKCKRPSAPSPAGTSSCWTIGRLPAPPCGAGGRVGPPAWWASRARVRRRDPRFCGDHVGHCRGRAGAQSARALRRAGQRAVHRGRSA